MSLLHDILRELIQHSTLGGFDKDRLAYAVDKDDPDVEVNPADEPVIPETPEQELARLRALVAAQSPGAVKASPASPANPVSENAV